MPYGLYISAAGAEVQSRRVQMLSNNLANIDTPGFKRELAVVQARHSEAIERQLDFAGSRSMNDIGGGVELVESATDFSAGTLKRTDVASDLALDNEEAFFVVERGGRELLTRAGNFIFGTDGVLQTPEGDPVLGNDGPVRIDPTRPWHIQDDGSVLQGNSAVARLRIESPASLGDLVKMGANMFAPLAETTPVAAGSTRVLSGYLEMSGVKPTSEMMEMIEASRAYEANVRLIQHQDQMLGSLVTRVLKQ